MRSIEERGKQILQDSIAGRCGTCSRTMSDCSEAASCLGWKPDEDKIELVKGRRSKEE